MWNINDYFNNHWWGWGGFMSSWGDDDPKAKRKKAYLAIIWWNLWFNALYFLIWLMDTDKSSVPYLLLSWFLNIFFSIPTVSIFIVFQWLLCYILIHELVQGILPKTKENLITIWQNINIILFWVLLNAFLGKYIFKTAHPLLDMWPFWILLLIGSSIILLLTIKTMFFNAKEIIMDLLWKGEVEEEESIQEETESPIWNYDWISQYYQYDLWGRSWNPLTEDKVWPKLFFYRFKVEPVLNFLIQRVNAVLMQNQSNLLSKVIYTEALEKSNTQPFIQIDYPDIKNKEAMDQFLSKTDFSNNYVNINNSFLALKLRTTYLDKPANLEKIGDEVLPNQLLNALLDITYSPKNKLEEGSSDYNQMKNEGKWKPYVLFSSVSIQKLDWIYYVVFTYSKWYRRLTIFPQLDPLTKVLEKNNAIQFENQSDPLVWFGTMAVWWLVWLKLSKIRHMLFWWESGSWKSVFLNSVVYQLLYRTTPDVVKLVLIDPLKVSFQKLKKIKSLAIKIWMTEEEAIENIDYLYQMNIDRYTFLESIWYEDIYSYNKDIAKWIINLVDESWLPTKYRLPNNTRFDNSDLEEIDEKYLKKKTYKEYEIWKFIPQVVLIYDEFNAYNWLPEYMKSWTLDKLIKLWEQARKAWIILILWTQKISADSVPSSLKENLPTKICLTVWSKDNSRAILWTQPENKSDWAFLSWYGDSLIFNNTELSQSEAIRSQGFYVSDNEMTDIIKKSLETFWMNDFLYGGEKKNPYQWLDYFYSQEEVTLESWEKIPDRIIERNNLEYENRKLNLPHLLPSLITLVNEFLEEKRADILDKSFVWSKDKNITIDTLTFKTESEMLDILNRLDYSNDYVTISKWFLRFKLNTQYLWDPKKLEDLESKMNFQFAKTIKEYTFSPLKELKDADYVKMLKDYDNVPYQLISQFLIVSKGNSFYLQVGFTPVYKTTVIFPKSKTIRQILTEKYGKKIEWLLEKKENLEPMI